jgi:GH25 family lysozyme M1 (1,4-beta-N-acetylmuramidase)
MFTYTYVNAAEVTETNSEPSITYSTHIQNIGWQNYVTEGETAGTSGQSLRLEGIKIKLDTGDLSGKIKYSTHIQDIGWQDWKTDDELSGTSGRSLRLEAIKIKLTGDIAKKYDIYYRVHVQDIGWQDWVKNGEMAGTSARSLRLEAIEIKLVAKDYEDTLIVHGIDVSSYEGKIDWSEVKEDNIDFAMIRVGFRGYGVSSDGVDGKLVKDTYFDYNISEANKAGIPVGVYFFSQAKTEEEAIEEANMVIDAIKNYKITYPVAIDTEYANSSHTGRADALTKEERTAVVDAFCKTIKAAGYTPMIYAGKNFANDNLDMDKLSEYDFWLAHYTGATQYDPLEVPSNYEGKYTMWQYTSSGTCDGIEHIVDRNIAYKAY